MHLSFISIFLLFNIVSYSLAQVPGRFDTSCGYLSKKIYCIGGLTGSARDPILDSSVMYLDIVNSSGNTTKELSTKWITITANTNGVNMQNRENPQSMALPDGRTLLLSGGWNADKSGLVSQTIAYNADSNSWSGYPSYTERPLGVRQIYYASSVYVPEYGVGFYGGIETNINRNWTYKGQNMSQYEYPDDNTARAIGYTSLTFFDIRKNVDPWFVFPTQNTLPTAFSLFQTSIFDTLSNRIFFFGGTYVTGSPEIMPYHSLGASITFNITSGNWGSQTLNGLPPTGRIGHTTTLLSSTNRDVLLYGGKTELDYGAPSLDYLFTLNLDSYEWKQQNIQNLNASDLVRAQHSAVPVYNNTLFIVFGRIAGRIPVSSLIILNVTDPSNISFLSSYVDPNSETHSINSSGSISGSGLSTGATAGIIVGAVAGGLAILTSIFFVWKKSKDKRKKEEMDRIQRQNERIESPVKEVNWEAIDKIFSIPPQLSGDSTTVTFNKPEFSSSPLSVPDTIEDDVKSRATMLQKPDGAL